VKEWEEVLPAMYLWRNVQAFAMKDKIVWNPGNTQVTIFDSRFLSFKD